MKISSAKFKQKEKNEDKPYSAAFIAKMQKSECDLKSGKTTKIEPADIGSLK
jgi:hypothetical protein